MRLAVPSFSFEEASWTSKNALPPIKWCAAIDDLGELLHPLLHHLVGRFFGHDFRVNAATLEKKVMA